MSGAPRFVYSVVYVLQIVKTTEVPVVIQVRIKVNKSRRYLRRRRPRRLVKKEEFK